MKQLYIFIALCFVAVSVRAQMKPFAVKNTRWNYFEAPVEVFYTNTYVCAGDTVINGDTCSVIRFAKVSGFSNSPLHTYVLGRDSDKVYAWDDSVKQMVKVFDFSLKQGDNLSGIFLEHHFQITIDSVRPFVINSIATRSWYYTLKLDNQPVYRQFKPFFNDYIGSGVFNILPIPLFNHLSLEMLKCFEDSILGFYENEAAPAFKGICDTFGGGGIDQYRNFQPLLHVYPNPAHDALSITVEKLQGACDIEVCDLVGHVMSTANITAEDRAISLDVSHLTPGLYMVSAKSAKGMCTAKILLH